MTAHRCRWSCKRTKCTLLVRAAGQHDQRARLWKLVPRAGKVRERLGDHDAVPVAQTAASRGFSGCSCLSACASAEANSVRESPSVEYRTAHRRSPSLTPMLACTACSMPWRAAHRLDEADRALERRERVLLEPVGERQVEQHLRVGRALDRRRTAPGSTASMSSRRIGVELVDQAVVHEQPATVAIGMAVGLLHGGTRGRPHVGEEQRRLDVSRRDRAGWRLPMPARRCDTRPVPPRCRTSRDRTRRRWSSRRPCGSAGSDRSGRAGA